MPYKFFRIYGSLEALSPTTDFFQVLVFDTKQEMHDYALTQVDSTVDFQAKTLTCPSGRGCYQDPYMLGEIIFSTESLNILIVLHELLHAAFQYVRVVSNNPSCTITEEGEEEVVSIHTALMGHLLAGMKLHNINITRLLPS